MKKIKNIKQLKKQKRLLHQRERELMRRINSGWDELRGDIRPRKALEQFRKCGDGKDSRNMNENNIFKSILSFGATLLARKLAKSAEERIRTFFG